MAPIGKPKRRITIEPLPGEAPRREMPPPSREPVKEPAAPKREKVPA
jgi:hypothetical protein